MQCQAYILVTRKQPACNVKACFLGKKYEIYLKMPSVESRYVVRLIYILTLNMLDKKFSRRQFEIFFLFFFFPKIGFYFSCKLSHKLYEISNLFF